MKIIIIGSVAAGTAALAKARRNSEDAHIVVYDRDMDISYSSCGLPYYVGSMVQREALTPRDAGWFRDRYNVDIHTGHEVLSVNHLSRTVEVKNILTGDVFTDSYDILVFATGAIPFVPSISGVDGPNVFFLRDVRSADEIRHFINTSRPRHAVVAGGGFIGLEIIENLVSRGMDVTLIEKGPHVMPPLDDDMAVYVHDVLERKGVHVITGDILAEINHEQQRVMTGGAKIIPADIVILALGVTPRTELTRAIGVKLDQTGAIITNDMMETSIPGIYAAGDCTATVSRITGQTIYRPLGSTASRTGRILGDVMTGGNLKFRGILGTGILRLFDKAIAFTGLTERDARGLGYNVIAAHAVKPDKSEYFPDSTPLVLKGIADRDTGKLLGAQVIGEHGADKRIDVLATAISFGAMVDDLFHLDLAYAPPYATTRDPVISLGMIMTNCLRTDRKLVTAAEFSSMRKRGEDVQIIDVRESHDYEQGHIVDAVNIPLAELRGRLQELDRRKTTVVHCNKVVSVNAAQNILLNNGFKRVYNLSGGYSHWAMVEKYRLLD